MSKSMGIGQIRVVPDVKMPVLTPDTILEVIGGNVPNLPERYELDFSRPGRLREQWEQWLTDMELADYTKTYNRTYAPQKIELNLKWLQSQLCLGQTLNTYFHQRGKDARRTALVIAAVGKDWATKPGATAPHCGHCRPGSDTMAEAPFTRCVYVANARGGACANCVFKNPDCDRACRG